MRVEGLCEKTLLIQTRRAVAVSHLQVQFGAKLENLWFRDEAPHRSWISLKIYDRKGLPACLPVFSAAAKSM